MYQLFIPWTINNPVTDTNLLHYRIYQSMKISKLYVMREANKYVSGNALSLHTVYLSSLSTRYLYNLIISI